MEIQDLMLKQNIMLSLTSEQLEEFANQILNGARAIYEKKVQPEQYLTRKQTAEMLRVDLSTLWQWNNDNYLCAIEIGGKRRYRMSDVKKILEGK
jgi:hypothetical protein